MQLEVYLKETGKTAPDFAKEIGAARITVYKYLSKDRIPEPDIMQKIFDATDGLVTANDFYGLTESPAANGNGHAGGEGE